MANNIECNSPHNSTPPYYDEVFNGGTPPPFRDLNELVAEGKKLYMQNQLLNALEKYNAVLSSDSHHPHALALRGLTHLCLKNFSQAKSDFTETLQFQPNDVAALSGLAQICHREFELARAQELFTKVLQSEPNNPFALSGLGRLAMEKCDLQGTGRYPAQEMQKAKQFLNQAFLVFPTFADNLAGIGHFFYIQNDCNQAKHFFATALKYDPNCDEAMTGLGHICYEEERLDEARQWYDKALAINPNRPNTLAGRGWIYYRKKEYDQALIDFNQALQLNPKHDEALPGRATLLCDKGEQLTQAQRDIKLYMNQQPQRPCGFAIKAKIKFKRNRTAKAKCLAEKVLKEVPHHSYALCVRGLVHLKENRIQEAQADFEHALQGNPDDTDAQEGFATAITKAVLD